ncbi:MAG: right-handed parallel beta-helix repeat-containing protein [Oscillospiraceae bacterium]|nr:right-handed parallel beta-helix repeat-containing protein [Oscillospiraceae bacterium]
MKLKRTINVITTTALCIATICSGITGNTSMVSQAEETRQILVTDTQGLIDALDGAQAGDEIILREGVYQNDEWLGEWAAFFSYGEGTAENPITLRSEDPENPATISGATQENKNALYILGSYWIIKDLRVTNAGKGIMLDHSNYSVISNCEVFDIGTEAIHLRDNSSYCLVENCYIHDAGTVTPKYGEGVYIGSSHKTEGYGFECHYNTVRGCKFGPNIAADHVDIKEYTIGTLVENCTFDGTAIQGENGGDSFVEIKGNNAVIRNNTGYRNGCEKVLYAYDANVQLDGWGQNNKIYNNTVYLDTTDCYLFKEWNCKTQVFRNTVEPQGVTCTGNKTIQILSIDYAGDVDENGVLDNEDICTMQDYLLGRDVAYISEKNADLHNGSNLDVFDMCLLRRKISNPDSSEKPEVTIDFVKEEAGKWRMCNGISGSVRFSLKAEANSVLNMAWGYWDPDYVKEDGTLGKWIQLSLGNKTADENGDVTVTVEVPEDVTRVDLEIYDYLVNNNDTNCDSVVLSEARTILG